MVTEMEDYSWAASLRKIYIGMTTHLQTDRKTMQSTHGLTMFLEIVITLFCPSYSLFEEDLCQTIDTLLRYGCSLAECRDYLLTLYLALAHELNQFSCIRQYKQSNRASNLHLLASYAEVSSSSLGVRRPHVAGTSNTELVAFSWNFDVKDSGSLHFSGI